MSEIRKIGKIETIVRAAYDAMWRVCVVAVCAVFAVVDVDVFYVVPNCDGEAMCTQK